MRSFSFHLILLCVVCLSACTKRPTAQDYDPAQAPLTADELAQLVGFDHWKIPAPPKSDRPYSGVRVVAFKPDHSLVGVSTTEQLGTSITADGNDQILVGIQRTGEGFTGTLMLGTRPNATGVTHFKFPYTNEKDRGYESHIGLGWHDNQAKLIRCVDENNQTTFSINVELLQRQPD